MICEHGSPVRPDEPFTLDQCYRCWRRARGGLNVVPHRGACLHLGAKIDGPRQARCQCRHICEAGEPFAVPAGNCQTCQKWEADA